MKFMRGLNRRQLLGRLAALPVVGSLLYPSSRAGAADKVDAITGPTFVTKSDKADYTRLKSLDLGSPKVVAQAGKMPVGKIGDLTLGRLMSGSNLISMNMHARDLDYVSSLAAQYNTEERIFMTLKR